MQICKICNGRFYGEYWDIGEKICEWVCDKCVSAYGAVVCYRKLRNKCLLPENRGYRPEYPPLDPNIHWDTAGVM